MLVQKYNLYSIIHKVPCYVLWPIGERSLAAIHDLVDHDVAFHAFNHTRTGFSSLEMAQVVWETRHVDSGRAAYVS